MGRVKWIFLLNLSRWVKKNSIQPNPLHKFNLTHMIHRFDNFFITIIIKLSKKNLSHLLFELINKIYINIWTNIPTQLYINIWTNIH